MFLTNISGLMIPLARAEIQMSNHTYGLELKMNQFNPQSLQKPIWIEGTVLYPNKP
jgi:hypothetical protein